MAQEHADTRNRHTSISGPGWGGRPGFQWPVSFFKRGAIRCAPVGAATSSPDQTVAARLSSPLERSLSRERRSASWSTGLVEQKWTLDAACFFQLTAAKTEPWPAY